MQGKFLFFAAMTVAAIAPAALKKYNRLPDKSLFDLTNLSKILFLLLIYYLLGYVITNNIPLTINEFFWFSAITNFFLNTAFIGAVLKYSPLINLREELISFPLLNKKSILYATIVFSFIFQSLSGYIAITKNPERLLNADIIRYTETNSLYVIFLFILEFYAVIGEELVFRYFTINALKQQRFSEKFILIYSALLWAFMHKSMSLGILISGILLAYFYIKTGNLTLCIASHYLFNLSVSSASFYVYFSKSNVINFTPLQYAAGLFIFSMGTILLLEKFLKKSSMA